jgi:hypothetical protein
MATLHASLSHVALELLIQGHTVQTLSADGHLLELVPPPIDAKLLIKKLAASLPDTRLPRDPPQATEFLPKRRGPGN